MAYTTGISITQRAFFFDFMKGASFFYGKSVSNKHNPRLRKLHIAKWDR